MLRTLLALLFLEGVASPFGLCCEGEKTLDKLKPTEVDLAKIATDPKLIARLQRATLGSQCLACKGFIALRESVTITGKLDKYNGMNDADKDHTFCITVDVDKNPDIKSSLFLGGVASVTLEAEIAKEVKDWNGKPVFPGWGPNAGDRVLIGGKSLTESEMIEWFQKQQGKSIRVTGSLVIECDSKDKACSTLNQMGLEIHPVSRVDAVSPASQR